MTTCPHTQEALVEITFIYDGALFFECMNCHRLRHRWATGTYQHRRADAWLEKRGLRAEPYRAEAA